MTDNQPSTPDSTSAAPQNQPPLRQQSLQARPHYDDEIDLIELWRALMRGKWFIIGFTAVFSIAAIFYAISLPNMYKSTVLLAPAQSSETGGGRLAGLASLAGLNIDGNNTALADEALQILSSWAFVEEFIQEESIAPQVFALKGWNQDTNDLIYDTEIYDPQKQTWTRDPPKRKLAEPSSWELYEVFLQKLTAGKDDKTGFYSISVESHSPELSKVWVEALLLKINGYLKSRDRETSEENILFLKQQAQNTELAGMQTVLFNLIEEQTKGLMLASGSQDYAFRVVREPRVAEEKSAPSRSVICIVSAFLGWVIGSFIALVRFKIYKRGVYHDQ